MTITLINLLFIYDRHLQSLCWATTCSRHLRNHRWFFFLVHGTRKDCLSWEGYGNGQQKGFTEFADSPLSPFAHSLTCVIFNPVRRISELVDLHDFY